MNEAPSSHKIPDRFRMPHSTASTTERWTMIWPSWHSGTCPHNHRQLYSKRRIKNCPLATTLTVYGSTDSIDEVHGSWPVAHSQVSLRSRVFLRQFRGKSGSQHRTTPMRCDAMVTKTRVEGLDSWPVVRSKLCYRVEPLLIVQILRVCTESIAEYKLYSDTRDQ